MEPEMQNIAFDGSTKSTVAKIRARGVFKRPL